MNLLSAFTKIGFEVFFYLKRSSANKIHHFVSSTNARNSLPRFQGTIGVSLQGGAGAGRWKPSSFNATKLCSLFSY